MKPQFDVLGHVYILATLALTVYGQIVLKWQMSSVGQLPAGGLPKVLFLLQQFLNPWIMSGFLSAFLASLAWMAAMTRFDLNYAYPFMSLAFVVVMAISIVFLNEMFSPQKALGTLLVVLGLIVVARG